MDPLTIAAGVAAAAGLGTGLRWRRRADRAEAEAERLRAELRAERHAASHDALTGLPNRRAFYEYGAASLADPAARPLVVVMVDLDNFKHVNDAYGHAVGDEVLVTAARRLAAYAGDNLVARLGGDEFAGLLTCPDVDTRWQHLATRRLAASIAAPMWVAGRSLSVTASVGLAPAYDCADLADALRRADAAMYEIKTAFHGEARRPAPAAYGRPGALAPVATWPGPASPVPRRLVDTTPGNQAGG